MYIKDYVTIPLNVKFNEKTINNRYYSKETIVAAFEKLKANNKDIYLYKTNLAAIEAFKNNQKNLKNLKSVIGTFVNYTINNNGILLQFYLFEPIIIQKCSFLIRGEIKMENNIILSDEEENELLKYVEIEEIYNFYLSNEYLKK